MTDETFLTTSQYARKYGISRMQVIRLIHSGQIPAQRVGRNWLISEIPTDINQTNFEKTTSLSKWNRIIQSRLKKKLAIESSKDREFIYTRMHSLGLPHYRFLVFQPNKFPTKKDFEIAIGRLGYPYWISAVPDLKSPHLDRQSKLRLFDIVSGWRFINRLPEKKKYKIIVSEYADNPDFAGTILISPAGHGIAEFITGDRHYILTRGFTLADPMLFDQEKIRRFSKTVSRIRQKELYNLVRGLFGHLEFQYGQIKKQKRLVFFDYGEEEAYVEIDQIWEDLIDYFRPSKKRDKRLLYGLPASPGKASGRCFVLHHESLGMLEKIKKGDILVSDTTTPEMTPLMEKAAAIVTDLGGVTSHAAIVCRELKIPAIVGVGRATEQLKSGEKIRVDADKGRVEVLS